MSKTEKWLDRAYSKGLKMGEDIFGIHVLESYKYFEKFTEEELEILALALEERLGFGRNLLSEEQKEIFDELILR